MARKVVSVLAGLYGVGVACSALAGMMFLALI